MGEAVKVAEEIFAPRSRFEKTEYRSKCRSCEFRGLCGREER
jgi:radical SAM protein with 4Fe4S-binding SPASM domain